MRKRLDSHSGHVRVPILAQSERSVRMLALEYIADVFVDNFILGIPALGKRYQSEYRTVDPLSYNRIIIGKIIDQIISGDVRNIVAYFIQSQCDAGVFCVFPAEIPGVLCKYVFQILVISRYIITRQTYTRSAYPNYSPFAACRTKPRLGNGLKQIPRSLLRVRSVYLRRNRKYCDRDQY